MPRPREYDDALRVRLIETAARLLTEEGPHALSTRRIAAEADTSTTAIYSLIGSKDELIRSMYREGFRRLAERFAAVEHTEDPVHDLAMLGEAYHATALENPQLYQLMFDCPLPEFAPNNDDVVISFGTFQTLLDAVQRGVDAGRIHGDVDDIAFTLWALSHGLAMLTIKGGIENADASWRQLRTACDALFRGLAAAPAAAAPAHRSV